MKKTTALFASIPFNGYVAILASSLTTFHVRNIPGFKKLVLAFIGVIAFFYSNATNYYNLTGATNANILASWTMDAGGAAGATPADFTSGDIFTIRAATTMNTNAPWMVSGTGSGIVISGTLTLSNALTINGGFTNNGTFNNGNQSVTIGTGGDIAGTGAITFFNLIISTANTTDIVTLSKTLITVKGGNGGANGKLTLSQGIFKVGAGNTINFDNNSSENSIDNSGASGTSNFAATGINGEDGGKIVALNGSGANFTIAGAGLITFYDFSVGTAVGQGNRAVIQTNPNVLINGTLTILDNQGKWRNNSPAYGPASTLSVNNNNQQFSPGGNDTKEWISLASGTIGTTQGYPNNVTLMNVGTSASNYNGESYGMKLSGTWSINGILQDGSSTVPGFIDLGPGTNFTCGGIIIENNSRLRSPDNAGSFVVKGNFLRTGATVGDFTASTSTVNFAGTGTTAAPQTITASNGSVTNFNNVTISNGTYVKLNSPVTLPAGYLLLNSGIIETSTTNILMIGFSSPNAISGGSSSNYINGPVKWLINGTNNSYTFPVGKGITYLPFVLVPNSSFANIATVEAFDINSGGAPDGITITSLSNTEYWSLSTANNFSNGASVSVSRPTAISPYNGLGKSTTANGIYSSVGGTAGTFGVTNSVSIGATSPWFFALGVAPLAVQAISIITPTCDGTTGTITVAGTGGTPPYTYKIGNGPFSSNPTFAGLDTGTYIITVMDATTPTAGTATVSVTVLAPVNIINNDTTICAGASVNLVATTVGTNYTWTPSGTLSASNIPNPVATPASTTTYTVTSQIVSNLLTNPGFEGGNTGFNSDYIYLSSNIPYNAAADNPLVGTTNHKGIYGLVTASNGLCVNFNNPVFNDHTSGSGLMMVIDGPNDGISTTSRMWSQTVSGLFTNTSYTFTYWIRYASSGTPLARVRTQFNGADAAGSSANPFTSPNGWTQVTYTWNSGANTSVTIDLFDLDNADTGNDYAIDDLAFGPSNCTASASITITVSNGSAPAPGVTSPVNYCQNATASPLTATGTALLWYTALTGGTGSAIAPTPSTATAGATPYYVSQTLTGSCGGESPRALITVNVTAVTAAPVVSNQASYCQNAMAVPLTATGTSLLWYTAAMGGTGSATAPTPSTATVGTASYFVSQTGTCGESPRAEIVVTVIAGTTAPAVTNPASYCQNATAAPLTATGIGLLWYAAATGGTGSATAPVPSTATVGTASYFVSQTGTCGESPRAEIVVTVTAATAPPAVTNPSYCQSAQAASLATNATGTGLLWYTASAGGTGSATAPTTSTAAAGTSTYYVSQSGSCGESSRSEITVTVTALPAVEAGPPQSVAPGSYVTLAATASQGTYLWSPSNAGLSDVNILNPVATPLQTSIYMLTVTGAGGCTASDNVTITVAGDCLNPPNVFTPNSDGFYDVWVIYNNQCIKQLRVDVYNRWGGLVYHSDNYDNKWNGTHSSKPLPDATYYYIINALFADGHVESRRGNVTIMR